jgi:Calpain family cysteine protease
MLNWVKKLVDGNKSGKSNKTARLSLENLEDRSVPSVTTVTVNHPTAAAGHAYANVNGSLFSGSGPNYRDVEQGAEGDCWVMSSLAEVADRNPNAIRNMFTDAGTGVENGTMVHLYNVRLFNSAGVAKYYQVDTELPSGGNYYDHIPADGALWAALAEKAFAQANGSSYDALNGGDPKNALKAITGKSAVSLTLPESTNPFFNAIDSAIDYAAIRTAWNAGEYVVLATSSRPSSSNLVGDHAYALVSFNTSSSQPFQLYNPWGANSSGWALGKYNGHQVYGLFTANAAFIAQNFNGQSNTVGAMADVNDNTSSPHGVADIVVAMEHKRERHGS